MEGLRPLPFQKQPPHFQYPPISKNSRTPSPPPSSPPLPNFRALFRWNLVVLLTLQEENSDFPELNDKVLGMELFVVLYKTTGLAHIPDIDLIYRQEVLFETITQLIAHWKKTKKNRE